MTTYKSIDALTAQRWLDKKEAVMVDVREPEEYERMHIVGATLVPLAVIEKNTLPPLNNKKLIIHCQLGKRGAAACEKLLQQDPEIEVYNLEGGILAWERAGYSVTKGQDNMMSIERQVQIVCGSGVLLGIITGYVVQPVFLLLAVLFGVGLIVSGFTGRCDLEKILKKMPWNQVQ